MKLFSIAAPLRLTRRAYSTRTRSERTSLSSLLHIIGPLGDPNASVLPALDDWFRQGNTARKWDLQTLIKELMTFRRFRHALEVSLWMTDDKRYPLSPYDIGLRLKLILKNFGLEQTENYFNMIPENMKTYQIYLALLNCYTVSKSVDKAESIMQSARDLGYANKAIWYNLMMNLHCQLGNREELGKLLTEMESKGVPYDQFTYSICLSSCVMASDAVGMERVVRIMESDPAASVHWQTLITAAEGYLRMGSIDEALVVLVKLEKQLKKSSRKYVLLAMLIRLYTEAGKKKEVGRIWKLYKDKKAVNKLYISMMRSLMKFNDIEEMEKIFEEWLSKATLFDFRVPNFLIDAYCTDGRLEKAEDLVAKVVSKGGAPLVTTWCHLAGGYMKKNQVDKAVRSLRKAISACPPKFVSQKHSLMTCLGYLLNDDRREEAEELIMSVRTRSNFKESASSIVEDQDSERLLLAEDGDDLLGNYSDQESMQL